MFSGKKGFGFVTLFTVGLASLILGIALTARLGITPPIGAETFWKENGDKKVEGPSLGINSFVELSKALNPVVVNISTTQVVKERGTQFPEFKSPFEDFFGGEDPFKFFGEMPQREFKRQSLGSGFIINKEGYILTNNHVVENAEEILVTFTNKKEHKAKIIGTDSRLDIALIKIDAGEDLPVAALGDSDKLQIGEWVMAIGNPFGLSHTVTSGIISAKGRVIGAGPYDNFIQTDASINPGNSGGPLFNLKGEVIGINTAIIAGGQGIGFATPINMAKEILIQLKEKGRVTRGWIGVTIQDVTPELAQSFGLKEKQGALVSSVSKGDPADKAGIKSGDIIIEFDNKEIKEVNDLPKTVAATLPGKTVKIKIMRDGKEKVLAITVATMKEEGEITAKEEKEEASPENKIGISVQPITPEIARRYGFKETDGVLVVQVKPDSPAGKAGIKRGDIIKEVNRLEITNLKDYKDAMKKAGKDKTVLFLIQRGSNTFYAAIKVKE
ncbi:MAG: DegQ family serine endoprotease [Deltaproteobacteria bacterium]|nr:DegQ family serine endoprotease [Deltaproteobacteria bacterium]